VTVLLAKALDRLAGPPLLRVLGAARAIQDLAGRYDTLRSVREICAVKFWGVGNAALLLPVLRALKARYPGARLTVVTLAPNRPVYAGVAHRILAVRARPLALAGADLLRVAARLRRQRIDLAIDFEQYARVSQGLLYVAGARQVVAFDDGAGRAALADVTVPADEGRHAGQGFLDLARAAGVRERTYRPGGLEVDPAAARRVEPWTRGRPLAVLHPGSGDNFPGRRWPTRRFGLLGRRLADEGAAVAVTGSQAEAHLVREVVEASDRGILDLGGKLALAELIALLARADLLVANDTGPVHLASALGVPVLALYGPNTPRLYGPLSARSRAFYDAPPCSPCITNSNYKTSRCLNPVCIHAIGVDEVAEAARRALSARRAERRA